MKPTKDNIDAALKMIVDTLPADKLPQRLYCFHYLRMQNTYMMILYPSQISI